MGRSRRSIGSHTQLISLLHLECRLRRREGPTGRIGSRAADRRQAETGRYLQKDAVTRMKRASGQIVRALMLE
jgi:hypothetical protein